MNVARLPRRASSTLAGVSILVCLFAALVGAAGCHVADGDGRGRIVEDGLKVVATLPVLAFLVRDVGGNDVHVSSLLPAGASPHTFEPTTGDVQQASTADLFLSAGAGLDSWAEKLRNSAGDRGRLRVAQLAGIDPIRNVHGTDPHVWLDPIRVRDVIVPALTEALASLDPSHADGYHARARALAKDLGRLDAYIRTLLARAPRHGYVAFHNAWRYFAQRYGLHELGVVEEAAGEEPSPRDLAELASRARKAHAKAILVEPQLNPRSAQTIASEFGGTTVIVDPLGDWKDPKRDDYGRLMLFNAHAFAVALGAVNDPQGTP